jgi:hypothetical protein
MRILFSLSASWPTITYSGKGNPLGKQDQTTPKTGASAKMSRKHLFALWGTLITVLGTSVVPKIMDLMSDRPSVTQVQDMIAKQTQVLTETANRHIDEMDKFENKVHELDKSLSRMEGLGESLREVVRDCCTRRIRHLERRLQPKPVAAKPAAKPHGPKDDVSPAAMLVSHVEEDMSPEEFLRVFREKMEKDRKASEGKEAAQQKLPAFNHRWMQQKSE